MFRLTSMVAEMHPLPEYPPCLSWPQLKEPQTEAEDAHNE